MALPELPIAALFTGASSPAKIILKVLNAALRQEPWAAQKLRPYAGKSIRFVSGSTQITAAIGSDGLLNAASAAVKPNVTVTVSPEDRRRLLQLVLEQREGRLSEIADLLYIEGEVGLARVISEVAQQFKLDKEHLFARVFGPLLGPELLKGHNKVVDGARHTAQNLSGNIGEFLNYEQNVTVSSAMMQDAATELAELEQRIVRLEQQLGKSSNTQ